MPPSLIIAIILTPYLNPFRDSLRSSQEDPHRFSRGRMERGGKAINAGYGKSGRLKLSPFESAGGLASLYIDHCFRDQR